MCCYDQGVAGTQCKAPVSRAVPYQGALGAPAPSAAPMMYQPMVEADDAPEAEAETVTRNVHLTNNGSGTLMLSITEFEDMNVTELLTDLIIPLKMEFDTRLSVEIYNNQTEQQCVPRDANCVGNKLLTCAMAQEQEAAEVIATEAQLHNVTQTEALLLEVNNRAQSRLLVFTACVMQSYFTGGIQRKQNALLAAKKCVRAHGYDWRRTRDCVSPSLLVGPLSETEPSNESPLVSEPVLTSETELPVPPESPASSGAEMPVQEAAGLLLEEMQQQVCSALQEQSVHALLCDLLQLQREQPQYEVAEAA